MSVDAQSNRVAGWAYDRAGNALSDGLHSDDVDANNRITSRDGGSTLFQCHAGAARLPPSDNARVEGLGRLVWEEHPEFCHQGVQYGVSYLYDDAGRMISKIDPRGIVTTISYDDLKPPLERQLLLFDPGGLRHRAYFGRLELGGLQQLYLRQNGTQAAGRQDHRRDRLFDVLGLQPGRPGSPATWDSHRWTSGT